MGKFRALWLMNHNTLRAFEVPMLLDMGYEVYCSKIFPYDEGNLSASVDFQYDESLTIPKEVIDKLNSINFYQDVPQDVIELINQYFDIAFFGFFPEQLKMLVEGFNGILVMQPFGLSNGVTYTRVIEDSLGIAFLDKLEKLGERFFFAQSYENIAEIEYRYFRNRTIYLPLGLKDAYVKDEWVGGDSKILFVCPRINTSPYFNNIYRTFKENFNGFEYIIGGAQPIDVTDDKKVAGFIPKEQYDYNMKHLDVMFYHSMEKRHLHYHPLEAVKNGMPLIYMSGGMLEQIAGKKLIGSCDSINEARKKIKRIMRKDKKFINQVKQDQAVLLKPFSYEFCRKIWDKELRKIEGLIEVNRKEQIKQKKVRKIGVLLPEAYTGGVLDYTLRFMKSIIRGLKEDHKEDIEIIFGHIEHENFEKEDYFSKIRDANIQIRSFKWKLVDNKYLNNIMELKGWFKRYPVGEYCIPDDGANYFEDCDYLIFIIDRVPTKLFTTKPYIVVVHDYIQRYLPEQYGEYYEECVINLQRESEGVIVMTQPTLEDGIQYAGLKKDKIYLTPLMFDEIKLEKKTVNNLEEEYFIWSTNVGRHKNHLRALAALADYYEGGGMLKCYITGVDTKKFDIQEKYEGQNAYILEVREFIKKEKLFKNKLVFCGNMSKNKYLNILGKAKFFMHPGFTDNGNMTAIDAAFLGVPTITSDYPAMRYYEEYMHLNMRFFNPFKPNELKQLLFDMEENHEKYKAMLPPSDRLREFTIEKTYRSLYNTVKNIIKF